ncbi:MAG: phosphatase PAP2 family protein [Trichormus sp. ATA11-4-KO1]|jgi:undecaprenyl-diphosphatase|nr:phosphatase PAP2 family protein [Trichormus sp. ATA11-4-KO1]
MNTDSDHISRDHPLIQTIHTAVKGRARYKVYGLQHSQTCKRYLEFKLSQDKKISHAFANSLTGNVLVNFSSDFSSHDIALLLQMIILDYIKEVKKLPGENVYIDTAPKIDQVGSEFVLVSGIVSTLVFSTGIIYKYGVDKVILLTIQKLHTPLFDYIMLGITLLGEPLIFLLICLGWELNWLYYNRQWQATSLGLVTSGAISLNYLLKLLFGRARPVLWNRLVNVSHHSFPSGHAMGAMMIYGFIGYVLAEQFPQWQKQIFALTVILIVAIGFSRLYLGVHWPTDVLAGYAVGLGCLIACIFIWELEQKYRFSGRY